MKEVDNFFHISSFLFNVFYIPTSCLEYKNIVIFFLHFCNLCKKKKRTLTNAFLGISIRLICSGNKFQYFFLKSKEELPSTILSNLIYKIELYKKHCENWHWYWNSESPLNWFHLNFISFELQNKIRYSSECNVL